jgi:hypothetical protein
MTDLFAADRLQFFLRNRADIKVWADIERDVMAATRQLLASSQSLIEERLFALDAGAEVVRRDNASWERIMCRRPEWPDWRGVALEWDRTVDPFEAQRSPKIGFFWVAQAGERSRAAFIEACFAAGVGAKGYRIPAGNAWPVLQQAKASADWWGDPDRWVESLVDRVIDLWSLTSVIAAEAFGIPAAQGERAISGG